MAMIQLRKAALAPLPNEEKATIETAFAQELLETLAFPVKTNVMIGPDGFYFQAGTEIYILSVDIQYVRKLCATEECPVTLQTESKKSPNDGG